jgi:hypothetical protein
MQRNIASIIAATYTHTQGEDGHILEYACEEVAPFLEDNPLFLIPRKKTCLHGRIQVIFNKHEKVAIELTEGMVKDLIKLFALLEANEVSPKDIDSRDFTTQNNQIMMTMPWRLEMDEKCMRLPQIQKTVESFFTYPKVAARYRDLLEQFFIGRSPRELLGHPVFWQVDRAKCFILDTASAREVLKKDFVKTSTDWIEAMKSSKLSALVNAQTAFYIRQGKKSSPSMETINCTWTFLFQMP